MIKKRTNVSDANHELCRVEIDAKIASGYFTSGSVMTETELATVKGRDWEDIEH
jgi:hypothetical protein